MSFLIIPQERRTSEIPFHSDLAPGRRFVFVGKPVEPQSAFYIVGRRVGAVPKDQPEWLEDHRHNCNTFYVYIGDREDLSGLRAVVTVEGRMFEARAPAAVLIPQYALHHYRLIEGSGWYFHVNLRRDYEESLTDPGEAVDSGTHEVEEIYKLAKRLDGQVNPRQWSFIDGRFVRPGIRLVVYQVMGNEPITAHFSSRRSAQASASLIIGAPGKTLEVEVQSETERTRGASLATIYHPEGVSCVYERMEGAGIVLEVELEQAQEVR